MTKICKFILLAASGFVLASAQAEIVVDVFDPDTLQALDKPGLYSLASMLGIRQTDGLKRMSLSAMNASGNAKYLALVNTITQDVEEIKSKAGVGLAYSAEHAETLAPSGNIGRHFDPYWLTSALAAFPLVAVVNRVDKKDFYPDSCGEIRFIYRLAYSRAQPEARSTLPVFLNIVFKVTAGSNGNCASEAKKWDFPAGLTKGEAGARQIMDGPLRASLAMKQIELNMQIVRFPSGLETEFGGQAIYLFRIFEEDVTTGGLKARPLENTIDVAALKDPALKTDLLKQLRNPENLKKIDEGTFVLENSQKRLLSKRALSFSTSGRSRLSNKPYTAALGPNGEGLGPVNLEGLKFIKSPAGLIERLNNSTCVGCHQSGGTAGFHLLGLGGGLNSAFNQVVLPFSPHYSAERERRFAQITALIEQRPFDTFRALSFMPVGTTANDRELCLLDNKDFVQLFACRTGTVCKATVQNSGVGVNIGECIYEGAAIAGHVCRVGVIKNGAQDLALGELFNLKSFKDKIDISREFGGATCGNPKGGVPLGRVAKSCDLNSSEGRLEFVDRINSYDDVPKQICAMRGGPQFDECAKATNPAQCLAGAPIVRAFLDTCYPGRFCREDYICQQLPAAISRDYSTDRRSVITSRVEKLTKMSIGFCVPNYFVFNMRTDGHISPR